jgi:predicted GNAT family acetyltransferase
MSHREIEDTLRAMEHGRPTETDFRFVDDPERQRWEVMDGDEIVAFAEYVTAPGRVIYTHTVVKPQHEGRGIGSQLARHVLDDAVGHGLRITPRCPFIRSYIERHAEYMPSVDMPDER